MRTFDFSKISRPQMELPQFRRQLAVLGYPGVAPVDVYSVSSVKDLVVWLEETFFATALSGEQRQALRGQAGDEWVAGPFHELLEQLGSPFSFGRLLNDVQRATVVEWLLNTALLMRYEEQADRLSGGDVVEGQGEDKYLVEDALAEALREGVEKNGMETSLRGDADELARQLGLPSAASEEEARSIVLACLKHALRLLQRERASKSGKTGAREDQESAWVELRPGNVSDLLRVMYCEDAGQLERRAATLLVVLQNLTAAPVVDAALGKGGR